MSHSQFAQQSNITGLAMPEPKIFAHQHSTHAESLHKNLLDEFFGRKARQIHGIDGPRHAVRPAVRVNVDHAAELAPRAPRQQNCSDEFQT